MPSPSVAEPAGGSPTGTEERLALEARGVTKRFGGVAALTHADFALEEGEVHAIVGDNGAGKSTLLKIIAGAHQPDSGEIRVNGVPVTMSSPRAAQELGVVTVFQDLALVDDLDAAANLFLGRELYHRPPLSWLGVLDKKTMRETAAQVMASLKVNLGPVDQMIGSMSGGQRQAVAVARAVAFGSKVIIMDEPTAALGVRETTAVLDLIRHLNDEGHSVVIVSHSLPDVFAVARRITILRHGRTVSVVRAKDTTLEEMVKLMTGVDA
jgi:simple sugar transport system ATP-binding protein